DGEAGQTDRGWEIANVCRNYGIGADNQGYREGWLQGVSYYCSYESGLYVGQSNQTYLGVCSGYGHQQFWRGYEHGRALFRADRYEAHPKPVFPPAARGATRQPHMVPERHKPELRQPAVRRPARVVPQVQRHMQQREQVQPHRVQPVPERSRAVRQPQPMLKRTQPQKPAAVRPVPVTKQAKPVKAQKPKVVSKKSEKKAAGDDHKPELNKGEGMGGKIESDKARTFDRRF
ncbi:MAG TPA: DUF2799 domain-containing protein, partial [Mariprofundaceae bacterium]|nr:DUF2799 domain-containing protein [Mariprofundaceae bacterium]